MLPPRSTLTTPQTIPVGRWIRYIVWFCAIAVSISALLALPPNSESAQETKARKASSSNQKQKSSKPQTPRTPEIKERGIVNTEVPDFKSDTPATAVVIGISSYPNLNASAQLKFAHSDAQAIRDFLVSDKGGFRQEDVTLLLNEEATEDQIMREIGRLQERTGPSSLALIFFAGHGVVNKAGQAFLVAADTKADDLFATGIDMDLLNSTVQKMRARSVVIITDACHSGALGESLKIGPIQNLSAKYFEQPLQRLDQSAFIFSAASPTQASIEDSDLRGGLFTHFTLQGLNGAADDNNDGVVTSQELYNHVVRTMSVETRKRNIAQVPEHNPSYDRSIPLGIVSELGRSKYKQWFNEDARFASLLAAFNEALEENRLTKPQDQSAWDYLTKLTNNPGTPVGTAKEKEEQFLRKVISEADKVISQSPLDSAMWEEAASNLERAHQLRREDRALHAKQYFCDVMALKTRGDIARAEYKSDLTLDLIEREGAADHSITIKIGQFYRELKRWEKAGRAYRLANNKSASETTEYADVLIKLSSHNEAEEQLRQALKKNADYRPALIMLGELLLRNPTKERVAEVLVHSTLALRLAPEDLEAEEIFGRVNLAMKDTQRAIASFTRIARLRPHSEARNRALRYLSQSYWNTGDLDRAISALRDAEANQTQDVEIYDMLAAQLDERGNVSEAIASAEKAASLSTGKPEHAQRVYKAAEYIERSGQLENAAFRYRTASGLTADARLRTAWESHARVLFLRSGRNAEANVQRTVSVRGTETQWHSSAINIPGGLDALKQLTGLTISGDDKRTLERVFDACLRNPSLGARLVNFYDDIPEFLRKIGKEGDALSGTLTLPAPNQQASASAREVLKFFGVNDKKGVRQIKSNDFDSRRYILEALGGDATKLRNGEPVRITVRSGELPLVHGFENWASIIKDGIKLQPDEQFLAFLKSAQTMRLYVGLSQLPEEALRDLRSAAFKAKQTELAEALYFAAPYLRFDQRGRLKIPGGAPGESNWREVTKTTSGLELMHALLFEKENRGALYLFCALASAGDIGDAISGSSKGNFATVFNLFRKSNVLVPREPFDFIDLLTHLRIENDEPRPPKVIEFWLKTETAMRLFAQMGKISAGGQIPLVKQIAVLTQIERERPDWAVNRDVVERIAALVTSNKEPQLETALDLGMTATQLIEYLAAIERIDVLPDPNAKATAIRSFQASFELIRQLVKESLMQRIQISEKLDRILRLDHTRSDYPLQFVSLLRSDVLGGNSQATGVELERKLVAALAHAYPVEIPSANPNAASRTAQLLDTSDFAQSQLSNFLAEQKVTKLAPVFDAIAALEDLNKNPGGTESLAKLKTSIEQFVDVEPQVDPKKKKQKTPAVPEVNLKSVVMQLSVPVEQSTIVGIRDRIAAYASEALLVHVYALAAFPKADGASFKPDITRTHDFTNLPWGATRVGSDGRISGSLTRLNQALAVLPKATSPSGSQRSTFEGAVLNSFQIIEPLLVTGSAEAFIARTQDLGEDVLALYKQGDELAAATLNQLDFLMSERRSLMVRNLVDRDIVAGVRALTPSELYSLGRIYFEKQMATTPLETLRNEPGSLGVVARIVSQHQIAGEKEIAHHLSRQIAQFGMSTSSVTGLNRLGLIIPEPYEYAAGFREDYRLAERVQDLKLALTRRAHRLGGSALFPVNLVVAQAALNNTTAQTRKAARGTYPPERDWLSLMASIQTLSDEEFARFVEQIAKGGQVRSVARSGWDDPVTSGSPGVDAKPQP